MNDRQALTHAIVNDLTLSNQEKTKLLNLSIGNPKTIIPPALSNLAMKFNSLHPATQIILSILGFGLGRYLLDKNDTHGKMINLDKPSNGYILKQ